jgi:hypothetical protein
MLARIGVLRALNHGESSVAAMSCELMKRYSKMTVKRGSYRSRRWRWLGRRNGRRGREAIRK